jgi:hypothetical protein
MKYILLFLFSTIVAAGVQAQTKIQDFDQLIALLKSGKKVNVVIDYGKCDLYSDGKKADKSPNAIGGMDFSTYEYFDSSIFKGRMPSFVTSSQTILINHPRYGYVYNYVKIKVKKDNSVEVVARYLKPRKLSAKYKVVMDELFTAKMDNGGAVAFYVN